MPGEPRRVSVSRFLLVVAVLIGLFLLLAPTKVQPVAWKPEPVNDRPPIFACTP